MDVLSNNSTNMNKASRGEDINSDRDENQSNRVLVVAPQPFFSDRGTPIAIFQVISSLREQGYGVDVLTYPIGEDPELPGVRVLRSSNPFRLRHVKIGFSLRKLLLDISLFRSLSRLIKRHQYQYIHAVEESVFPAAILCRRQGLPLIYDMQSSLPEQMSEMTFFGLPPIQAALRGAERWSLMRANVTACSLGLRSHVKSINPNAVVQEWWFPSQTSQADADQVTRIRKEYGLRSGSRVVLYCGSFEPYQGLGELIKAAPRVIEQVPDTVFLLVGDNQDNPYRLTSEGRQLVAAGRLQIVPRQPSGMIPNYYDVADIMVSPRAYGSNIPLKVFDYMASGRPIVATDIPAHRKILNADRSELVAPNATALAGALVGLLTDREKSSRLGEAAKYYAEQHLGWPRFCASVKTIYDKALEGTAIDARE